MTEWRMSGGIDARRVLPQALLPEARLWRVDEPVSNADVLKKRFRLIIRPACVIMIQTVKRKPNAWRRAKDSLRAHGCPPFAV